ncbi:MAG: DSD1 family PLP-dependent enzyme [Clostridia bacterium]|nr:DSD1 family PLP-dependent enzyme [Clostridia bacterium]
MKVKDLETPALVVIRDRMEYNLNKMVGMLEGGKAKLRPHYKSHKCPEIAAMQIEAGAIGITCAKLSEAEDLIEYGIKDILIANQVVQPSKILRLAALARCCRLTVCVDCEENIRAISDAASVAGSTVNLYIEFDVGMKRCGVDEFSEVYRLACIIDALPGVTYGGIQAYAGNLAHEYDKEKREREALINRERVNALAYYLEQRGIKNPEISGGSTGTSYLKSDGSVYTEIQAGSFMFMDRAYGRMELGFRNSLFVIATVISVKEDRVVIDAGMKSLTTDQGEPLICGWDHDSISLSEEHTTFYGAHKFRVGDMVMVIPGHCCTTVNLYDELYFVQGENVLRKLSVTGRGKSR